MVPFINTSFETSCCDLTITIMNSCMLLVPLLLHVFVALFSSHLALAANSKLFREYIGGEGNGITFSDVPIYQEVDFHFILSFAIDYTTSSSPPSPTDGDFKVYWDTGKLSPSRVSSIKTHHPNVKVAMSLGGDTVIKDEKVFFSPKTINSWVRNAIRSITDISREYHLDGIDIDYEHFHHQADPDTFAECIGRLIFALKQNRVVSFASIAPYDNDSLRPHYFALWRKYGHLIDYVNFQFYAYDKSTNVSQFLKYFDEQNSNYRGGKILASFSTDLSSGGLSPEKGFFEACQRLKHEGKLHGIFVWSADDSMKAGFPYEKRSQTLLTEST